MKHFKRGAKLTILPTFACNLDCYYCNNKAGTGKTVKSKIISLDKWKEIITNFPFKIKEIIITGGEFSLYPEYISLVNWLLSKKYFITIWTNLRIPLKFNRSRHLQIGATYHKDFDMDTFYENYKKTKKHHNIFIIEMGERTFKESRMKDMLLCYKCQGKEKHCDAVDRCTTCESNTFRIAPDGKPYLNLMSMLKYYG